VNDRRPEGHGDNETQEPKPVPRDMPDQQAGADEDPWDVDEDSTRPAADEPPDPGAPDTETPDTEIPDTDDVGTGRRGAPHSGSPRPEHPVPDEPSG
jgi:hypothetical protein